MKVVRDYVDDEQRSLSYLVGCSVSRTAMLIDPFDADLLLEIAKDENFEVRLIVNTHAHVDLCRSSNLIKRRTGALICANYFARDTIVGVDIPLKDGQRIDLGLESFEVLMNPGSTSSQLCLLSKRSEGSEPRKLFSGDFLFNGSVGDFQNCGGVDDLYKWISETLILLEDSITLYPCHDDLLKSVSFALDCDPMNESAQDLLDSLNLGYCGALAPDFFFLSCEKDINPFLRLQDDAIIGRVHALCGSVNPSPKEVFIALRSLRDRW
ncbi:hypothetical protein OO256_07440 [Pseudomonas sp. DCB_CB]|uniref:hydroxyacylglutathione hydrolase C-terminal domain-containing protein n=1 Tax=Pseudomonas TaxID=286 RepID=UPI0022491C3D|nr:MULTISPECIES: hydroxyacylglutathione hydrolase C-terminal domain-containing protein [unclassified Pseudomonas]MCX2691080.1 hypothetical protein [Pseudomonas sp. DCB_BZ]MCX2855937.1 hypothetical protein [Pseudomonas sp. DCB_CB]